MESYWQSPKTDGMISAVMIRRDVKLKQPHKTTSPMYEPRHTCHLSGELKILQRESIEEPLCCLKELKIYMLKFWLACQMTSGGWLLFLKFWPPEIGVHKGEVVPFSNIHD